MDYKQLGSTSVQIPDIGLGTWAYTGSEVPLRRGIDLGACLIDTAESYGTEYSIGQSIRKIRDKVFIATKVSPHNFRRGEVFKAADRSLAQLKIDYIDLYQLHWWNDAIPIEETMGAMESLVQVGKVRFIGVSNFSVLQLKKAQATLSKEEIVANQVEYSLVARKVEDDVLSYCQEQNISIIAYSPLAEGLSHIMEKDRLGVVSKVANLIGKTPAQVALNWCISKEGIIAIPKANSVNHVEENCLASGWRLSAEHLRCLDQAF
jgi:diketogulonate reductase-like aldo/keto reductase